MHKRIKLDLSVDDLLKYQKDTGRKPVLDNPFMNPYTVDYNNDDFIDVNALISFSILSSFFRINSSSASILFIFLSVAI